MSRPKGRKRLTDTFSLPIELLKKIGEECEATKLKKSTIVEMALEEYFENKKQNKN